MTLERFLEIINNKEYEKLEYSNSHNMARFHDDSIKIYTRNGAFIRFRLDYHVKGFFHMTVTSYFDIHFFVPGEDRSVSNYRVTEQESIYKTLQSLFYLLKAEIRQEQANKYF